MATAQADFHATLEPADVIVKAGSSVDYEIHLDEDCPTGALHNPELRVELQAGVNRPGFSQSQNVTGVFPAQVCQVQPRQSITLRVKLTADGNATPGPAELVLGFAFTRTDGLGALFPEYGPLEFRPKFTVLERSAPPGPSTPAPGVGMPLTIALLCLAVAARRSD